GLMFATTLVLAVVLVQTGERLIRAGDGTWIDVLVNGQPAVPRLLAGPVLHVGFAFVVFTALCLGGPVSGGRPALRWGVGSLLGLLLMLDAAAGANFRINGPQNRAGSSPLARDNLLLADPHDFPPPSPAARQAFGRRLQTEHYRSVV